MTKKVKGTIAILTGGGDVPGLNPAIRAITIRAMREGYKVIGLRRGWAGIVELNQEKKLEPFKHQSEAISAWKKSGRRGLVVLPTGAGKTAIAEEFFSRNMASGVRLFYAVPIKALANDKFRFPVPLSTASLAFLVQHT